MRGHLQVLLVAVIVGSSLTLGTAGAPAQPGPALHIVEVSGLMTRPVVAALHEAFAASAEGSLGLLVVLDSPGTVRIGVPVVTPMLDRTTPVAVVVPSGGQAASGAGWVAAMADVLLMGEDATVGPLLPADLAQGPAGSRDPHTTGLREYNQLRRLLDLPGARARAAAADLSSGRHDAVSMAALGLVDGSASSRDEAIAMVGSLDGSPFHLTSETPLVFHAQRLPARLLQMAATPTGSYIALIGVLAALVALVFTRTLGTALLGVAVPLGVYGLITLPARWWAVALLTFALVALLWDVGFVWLGVPTALALLAFTTGSIALFHGSQELDVSMLLIGIGAGLAVVASAAGRTRQDSRSRQEIT